MLAGLGIGFGSAMIGSVGSHSPLIGGAIGLLLAGLIWVLAAWSLADPARRAAIELINDHNAFERAEWRAEIGGRIPVGVARQERWLADHPSGPGRATVLQALGRLDEADKVINEIEPTTPDERFGMEVLRQTSLLLSGRHPDVSALAGSWRDLVDPAERRHRRECLALLEAMTAVGDGQDPLVPLAAARHEIGDVAPGMRLERLLLRWAGVGVLAILLAALLGLAMT